VDPAKLAFPLPYNPDVGSIRLAPLPDGRVWVSIGRGGGDTALALLDTNGRGSPLIVPASDDCVPLALADASVRLLCSNFEGIDIECEDLCFANEAMFAFDSDGQPVPGFPVALPAGFESGVDRRQARVVGDNVVLVYSDVGAGAGAEEGIDGIADVLTVGPDGTMRHGATVPRPSDCCVVGPTGVAYGTSGQTLDDGSQTTSVVAFDAAGIRPGWPIELAGDGSMPAFVDSRVAVSVWTGKGSSELALFEADGQRVGGDARTIIPASVDWDPDWDAHLAPAADDRGHLWLLADGHVRGFDATAQPLPGWPYEPETGIVLRGECGPNDTGCQPWYEPPVAAPRGLVYTLETGPEGMGGRINVVNLDATTRSGWPVTLQREGASWDSVTIGENRIAYAVAIEPEPNNKSSISILAFAPNGTRQWITTLVEP